MNKYFFIIPFLLFQSTSFAQAGQPVATGSKEFYVQKAKGQRTAAWILAGAGATLISAGTVIGFGETVNSFANIFSGETDTYDNTGEVLFYSGLLMLGGSIPLFIAAGRNKRKAGQINASIKLEDRWQSSGISLGRKYYPALNLSIPLN